MITIVINKRTREIFMGKAEDDILPAEEIVLEDVQQVNWMEVKQGQVVPVPSDYLHLVDSMIVESALPEEIWFDINDYFVWFEKDIKKEMLDWYTQVMAKKSGIEIVGSGSNILM